jgi:acyl-CoA thioesterase I
LNRKSTATSPTTERNQLESGQGQRQNENRLDRRQWPGRRILRELVRRGHEVTAIARNPERITPVDGVTVRKGDVFVGIRTFQPIAIACLALLGGFLLLVASANAATVVALGASNTYGKGVERNQAYPAQLETILRARGYGVTVVNAGINGDTTEGMLNRLDSAVPNGTRTVILQPGGNDLRKGRADRTAEIQSRLRARGIRVIMLGNNMLHSLPHQVDGIHLTPDGYRMLAQSLASQVAGAIGR